MELTFQFLHNGHLTIEFLKLRQPAEASGSAGKFCPPGEKRTGIPVDFKLFRHSPDEKFSAGMPAFAEWCGFLERLPEIKAPLYIRGRLKNDKTAAWRVFFR
ncbi:MAG: hypothetical protein HFG13_06065 [Oscillibacter sp.]|nr:hypothetical protein [Oscillibacter sp.]